MKKKSGPFKPIQSKIVVHSKKPTKSKFEGWRMTKVHETFGKGAKTTGTIQQYYTASKKVPTSSLDKTFSRALKQKNNKGVLLVFKVHDKDSDTMMYASDYITKGLFERLQKTGTSLYDHLSYKLKNSKSVSEYELKSINMRIINEKPIKSKKATNTRKN